MVNKTNSKNKMKLICIDGTDGAGKTAVSNYVIKNLKGFKLRHMGQTYIPHNKIKFGKKKEKKSDNKQKNFKQKSIFYDFIANIIMTLELTIVYFFKEKIKGNKVLMDHSPYHVLLENNRRRFPFLEKILVKILLKPDITFILYDTPNNIRKRKKQRSNEEIVYYYDNIIDILKKHKINHEVIQVEEGIEKTGNKILKKLKQSS